MTRKPSVDGVRKPRWTKNKTGEKSAPPRKAIVAVRQADHRVRSGQAAGEPGVPKAIGREPAAKLSLNPLPAAGDARAAWTLDMLAFARHGRVADRIDLRASRATMPPVVLADGEGPIVALDDASAIGRLSSRSRAFSQIAARYAALGLVAREQERPLIVELWDLGAIMGDEPPIPNLAETAAALARYLEATFVLTTVDDLHGGLRSLRGVELPKTIRDRNPMAWLIPAVTTALGTDA